VAYYLGIDGGGSKTKCAVGDENTQLALANAGPTNITRVGRDRARESLHQAIREACALGRIDPRQIQRACIGVAGAGRAEVANAVREIVAEVIPGGLQITGDMEIALAAAFGEGPGVVVIAGTGSIAYGRNERGQTGRAGGWGFAISDEGSAQWIGRAAVAGLLRDIDERFKEKSADSAEGSRLFQEMKTAWSLGSFDDFLRKANSNPDFPALFPAVVAAHEAGEAVAARVLGEAAEELARIAGIVTRRLFRKDDDNPTPVPLAMAGGVFRHSAGLRELFCGEIRRLDLGLVINRQVVEPVVGALQMARRGFAQAT